MITTRPLNEATVLIVGSGDLVNKVLERLVSENVLSITVLDELIAPSEVRVHFIQRNPEEFIAADQRYFANFDIVLCANQPRRFELALSEIRWPKNGARSDPDLPMIVMRAVGNNCKMRCQYRELPVKNSSPSTFVNLSMDLPAWTDEKRALVTSVIKQEFNLERDLRLKAYLAAAKSIIDYHRAKGEWPSTKQAATVKESLGHNSQPQAQDFVDLFCAEGLAAAQESISLMALLVTMDTLKLLTGEGLPINTTTLKDVIITVTEMHLSCFVPTILLCNV